MKSEQERTKERDDAYAKEQNEARVRQEREARQKKAREQAAARGRGGGRGGFFGVKHESSGPLSGGSAISCKSLQCLLYVNALINMHSFRWSRQGISKTMGTKQPFGRKPSWSRHCQDSRRDWRPEWRWRWWRRRK